jgi:small-conductance mechanosensitive channel
VLGPDYNIYMDIQQEINLAIREEFGKRGIEFAYPTQTLFIQKN